MLTSWFYPFPSGSANRFYEIGKRLSRNHEVHVYTTSLNQKREETLEGIHLHRYGRISLSESLEKGVAWLNLKFSIDTMRRIVRDVKRRRFDVIDCNMTSKTLPFVSFLASRLWDIPLVETWHEVWHTYNFTQYNPFIAPIAMTAEYIIPRLSTRCIAVSNTTRQRLMELLGIPSGKVEVIPNGVDVNAFQRIDVEKKKARLVYVGRLESHKRVDVLLRAFKMLRKKFPEIELIIVGDGSQRRHLVKLSLNMGLNNVRFLGAIPRPELIRTIKSSTVLVLPSILEGQGIVLLESMAAGTPPIAVLSPGSGVRDVVKHGFNGLLVGLGIEEIEDAVYRLLTSQFIYDQIQKNALKFVKAFDWNAVAVRVSKFYEHLVEESAR